MSLGAEVVVVGGGPAGASAARLLALWGRRVLLLTRSPRDRPGLAESLPPSARKLLDVFRLTEAVDAAGFLPARGNTVWWKGRAGSRTEFPDGTGWQIERRRFDALLLSLAADAGAEVRRGATVDSVDLDGDEPWVEWRTEDRGGARARERAPVVLDCSGRAGVVASGRFRLREDAAPMNALVGAWRRPGGWNLPDPSHTLVESYEDGWAWSIPVDPEVRYFTAMVDPQVTELHREGGVEAMYRGELDKTVRMRDLVDGAEPESTPWSCGATPYAASRYAGPGFFLVGDAASFIDPLSSYGVKKALASAWLAAVAVNTLLDEPGLEDAALNLFEAREREACRSYLAQAASFYAEGAAAHDHPFWERRASDASSPGARKGVAADPLTDAVEATQIGEGDVEALRSDPRVLAAFRDLREAPDPTLRPAEPPELVRAPTVRGRRIALEDRLATPSFPEGIRYLRDVDLVSLTRLAVTARPDESSVPGLFERYREADGPVSLPDFLGAVSVLLAEGVLENPAAEGRAREAVPERPESSPSSDSRAVEGSHP